MESKTLTKQSIIWDTIPDISCLYCVAMGEKTTYITFEYQGGRVRHGRWKIPHYLTNNENQDPTINLSFQFQLI